MPALAVPGRERFDRVTRTKMRSVALWHNGMVIAARTLSAQQAIAVARGSALVVATVRRHRLAMQSADSGAHPQSQLLASREWPCWLSQFAGCVNRN
jgi:hypothetical protein